MMALYPLWSKFRHRQLVQIKRQLKQAVKLFGVACGQMAASRTSISYEDKMYIKLDREYELKTTLGTTFDIEQIFGKSFFDIVEAINSMSAKEQIKLLYIGAKKAQPSLSEQDFLLACEDNLGVGMLSEYIGEYFLALQYPGLTAQEAQEVIKKKLQESQTWEAAE